MFERFTEQARRAVAQARDEARATGHSRAGTEHLLLGLLGEDEGVAAQALASLGVDRPAVREHVTQAGSAPASGAAGPPPTSGDVSWTPAAQNVLECALREALRLGHNHIGTEHLLLSLASDPTCEGALTLAALGLDGTTVRRAVITLLHAPPDVVPPPHTSHQ
jgi:ATP-dependent Clp protease ATP-binding subunit ClpC